MELKKKFVLRNIVGETILVPIGQNNEAFNGLISINELGKFIWENIESAKDKEELLQRILDEYEVDKDIAKADLDEFLGKLKAVDII
ncbi:MAG: PqqD family protein [Intestinibacter bartlettii]|uniref:PqqD family protein n=1 Tax=Intestinibacter bartlettii TaxID=261299 RepID=UPI00241E1D4E|nr:PqqD family protein [Intestinibacter bartlettii]